MAGLVDNQPEAALYAISGLIQRFMNYSHVIALIPSWGSLALPSLINLRNFNLPTSGTAALATALHQLLINSGYTFC